MIKKELIEKKILELEYTEFSDIIITTELFEKYDNMCRKNKYVNCIVWGEWLEKNRSTNIRQLQRFEERKKEREILSANKSARKHSVVCTYIRSYHDKLYHKCDNAYFCLLITHHTTVSATIIVKFTTSLL